MAQKFSSSTFQAAGIDALADGVARKFFEFSFCYSVRKVVQSDFAPNLPNRIFAPNFKPDN